MPVYILIWSQKCERLFLDFLWALLQWILYFSVGHWPNLCLDFAVLLNIRFVFTIIQYINTVFFSRSRSRSRSRGRRYSGRRRSRSRSHSRSYSRSKSRSGSRSRSRSRDRKEHSRSGSKSHSRSPARSEGSAKDEIQQNGDWAVSFIVGACCNRVCSMLSWHLNWARTAGLPDLAGHYL